MGKAEEQIIEEIKIRANKGLEKYNYTTDRTDLTLLEWLQHSKEESLDNAIYNQVIINKLESLKQLCNHYKRVSETLIYKDKAQELCDTEYEIFQEAMKLMLGDGIIEYLKCL